MSIRSLIGIKLKDRFKLYDLVGSGGFSSVYMARDEQNGRVVAVKVLHGHLATNPEILVRFHGELRKAQKLRQANVVEYYEEGVDQGLHYLVMEFLQGQTLAQVLKNKGRLPVEQILSILTQV
ncbi:MAG: protein kinase, partial [Deltaproteobacteria bacterium]